MPFGRKPDVGGTLIDFDAVYAEVLAPAIDDAGLEPLRADEEMVGGLIHKPMFERLILCEYAIADLTTANANVFYELGLRHAVRAWSTVLVHAEGGRLPFDVAPLRALAYGLGADGKPANPDADRKVIATSLDAARRPLTDSPVYQLVEGFPDIQRLKTDVFRDRVEYSAQQKERLAVARTIDLAAVGEVEETLGPIADLEAGVAIDLLLSYRAVKGWDQMVALAERMSPPLARTVLVREQLGLALNRAGKSTEAERVLTELLAERGPGSETYGILGRVYKDRYEAAQSAGETLRAEGLLRKAIATYLAGFEADWRDAYPGINAVTLMELANPPDPRRDQLIPVVRYAVERRIAAGKPDYWDHATRLELAVLARDQASAAVALADALASLREGWEAETTARNLRMIREVREGRGDGVAWQGEIERTLLGELTVASQTADAPGGPSQ
jgi:hypothetical protein